MTTAVDGSPLAPESIRMLEYLQARSRELSAAAICDRVRAAAKELETVAAGVPVEKIRIRTAPGKWTIAEVVDHISQTQLRGAEELRHLLAGQRPPLPPVYEALRSGAGQWAPWDTLLNELREANRAMIEVLESAPESDALIATVRTVMVALCAREDGSKKSQIWFEDLPWKQYALLQRLHLLDHRTQVRNLLAQLTTSRPACEPPAASPIAPAPAAST